MQDKLPGSLHDKFQDFGAAPREQLWNNIAANLDEDNRESSRRKGAFWWWYVGAAAVVVLFFGVYQLGYNEGVSENNAIIVNNKIQHSKNKNSNNQNQQNAITSHQNLVDQTNSSQNSSNANNLTNPIEHPENSVNNIADNSNKNQLSVNKNKVVNQNLQNDVVKNEPELIIPETFKTEANVTSDEIKKMPPSEIALLAHSFIEPKFNFEPLPIILKSNPIGKWEIGFNVGALASIQESEKNQSLDQFNILTVPDNLSAENSINGTGLASNSSLFETAAKIFRPIQAEFTFAHKIGHRWNFQSGLGLGVLASSNFYSSGNALSVRSKFLTINIPLHFNYDLIQRNRFTFYTGIGVNYEVPVFEKIKTVDVNPALESASTKKFTKGYMISGQLSTGFRFNLNQNLKLDFRPNVRYYIHQTMTSLYPALERKFWVGATVGLVWRL